MVKLPMALPERIERPQALYVRTSLPAAFGPGFHDEERTELDVFRWMGANGRLTFAPAPAQRYLEAWVLSEFPDLSQELECSCGGARTRLTLPSGWTLISLPIDAGAAHADLSLNKVLPRAHHPTDSRPLGVRMRPPVVHEDPERHARIDRQRANAVLNMREMLTGRAALTSTPVNLGIDLHGACNVKPPCVYCEWDESKRLEGDHVDTPFTLDTLAGWGPFFDNSVNLVNCSIGEPFMAKDFDDLLDAFGDGGKVLEMATNGQILTDRNIRRLIGRPIDLYVSLDAATPETYATLRNDRFAAILENLRRLIAAKGGPGRLPRIYLVFMPMRANVAELDAFVRLSADLQVDRLVLRPLNVSDSITLDWTRAGYRFQYQKELLPFETLVRVSGRAAELCRRHGVALSDQMDFGGAMGDEFSRLYEEGRRSVAGDLAAVPGAAPTADDAVASQEGTVRSAAASRPAPVEDPERVVQAPAGPGQMPSAAVNGEVPLCTEPWKSLYILRRGVLPCCYGAKPLAPMEGYRNVWNSPEMQHIRTALASGWFPRYCLASTTCPIVQKAQQGARLAPTQAVHLRLRRIWGRVDRVAGGVPSRVYAFVRKPVGLAWRALADRSRTAAGARR